MHRRVVHTYGQPKKKSMQPSLYDGRSDDAFDEIIAGLREKLHLKTTAQGTAQCPSSDLSSEFLSPCDVEVEKSSAFNSSQDKCFQNSSSSDTEKSSSLNALDMFHTCTENTPMVSGKSKAKEHRLRSKEFSPFQERHQNKSAVKKKWKRRPCLLFTPDKIGTSAEGKRKINGVNTLDMQDQDQSNLPIENMKKHHSLVTTDLSVVEQVFDKSEINDSCLHLQKKDQNDCTPGLTHETKAMHEESPTYREYLNFNDADKKSTTPSPSGPDDSPLVHSYNMSCKESGSPQSPLMFTFNSKLVSSTPYNPCISHPVVEFSSDSKECLNSSPDFRGFQSLDEKKQKLEALHEMMKMESYTTSVCAYDEIPVLAATSLAIANTSCLPSLANELPVSSVPCKTCSTLTNVTNASQISPCAASLPSNVNASTELNNVSETSVPSNVMKSGSSYLPNKDSSLKNVSMTSSPVSACDNSSSRNVSASNSLKNGCDTSSQPNSNATESSGDCPLINPLLIPWSFSPSIDICSFRAANISGSLCNIGDISSHHNGISIDSSCSTNGDPLQNSILFSPIQSVTTNSSNNSSTNWPLNNSCANYSPCDTSALHSPNIAPSFCSSVASHETSSPHTFITGVVPGKKWRRSLAFITDRKKRQCSNLSILHESDLSFEDNESPERHFLKMCGQTAPNSIGHHFSVNRLAGAEKLGEGVYGEVFRIGNTVVKLIPVEGEVTFNDETQKKIKDVLVEVQICQALSNLAKAKDNHLTDGYVKLQGCRLLKGRFPKGLLTLWDKFDQEKKSENDRPCHFPPSQLFVCMEFDPAGCDLEKFQLQSSAQAVSIFWQVACSLAVAEVKFKFEHRDLHWGNILVAKTSSQYLEAQIEDQKWILHTHGAKATVIDYTFSRASLETGVVYCDLSNDPTLFEATGDPQFQVYRDMREENDNKWQPFHSFTNVLWLEYLLDKLTCQVRYCFGAKPEEGDLKKMKALHQRVQRYNSATELVQCEASEYLEGSSFTDG